VHIILVGIAEVTVRIGIERPVSVIASLVVIEVIYEQSSPSYANRLWLKSASQSTNISEVSPASAVHTNPESYPLPL